MKCKMNTGYLLSTHHTFPAGLPRVCNNYNYMISLNLVYGSHQGNPEYHTWEIQMNISY